MADDNEKAIIVACQTCDGWTAMMVHDENTTAEDRREDAKVVAKGIKNGRTVRTVSADVARATPVCKCPRPGRARKGR